MEEDPLISRGNIQNADRQSETYGYTGQIGQGDNVKEDADKKKVNLTLLLLNTTCPDLTNNVDPDQLASEEANWSGSALFVIKYVNFYQKPGSSNLIGWKLEVGMAF